MLVDPVYNVPATSTKHKLISVCTRNNIRMLESLIKDFQELFAYGWESVGLHLISFGEVTSSYNCASFKNSTRASGIGWPVATKLIASSSFCSSSKSL
jgi:hypothetical protein